MSSAYSITASVNPPRAVYLDFPLGHTAGKAHDKPLQRRIIIDTLSALDSIQVPGTMRRLSYQWSESDDWKDRVMRPSTNSGGKTNDDRIERFPEPQYQLPEDQQAAEAQMTGNSCPGCIWPEKV